MKEETVYLARPFAWVEMMRQGLLRGKQGMDSLIPAKIGKGCCAAFSARRRFADILRARDGVAAIEFAMIVMPLMMLIVGIVEVGLFFAAGSVLEGASNEAARGIRTGQVQLSADPETTFAESFCDHASKMIDCGRVQYEVINIAEGTFAASDGYEPEYDADGGLVAQPFTAGGANDVIMIRAIYRHEFFTPWLGEMMTGDIERNWMEHMSTVVLRSEPYEFEEE